MFGDLIRRLVGRPRAAFAAEPVPFDGTIDGERTWDEMLDTVTPAGRILREGAERTKARQDAVYDDLRAGFDRVNDYYREWRPDSPEALQEWRDGLREAKREMVRSVIALHSRADVDAVLRYRFNQSLERDYSIWS